MFCFRIWLPTFWGVLVLLIGTNTQKPDKDITKPLRTLPDAKRPSTQPDHLQTDNTNSETPSERNTRLPLDNVTHTLTENNYQLTKENPLTETSESFSLSYKQSLNNKNNTNNARTLSITNNGNAGHLTLPVFIQSNESVHNNSTDNQEDFEISSHAVNTTKNDYYNQINEQKSTAAEQNKTESLYITRRVDSLDISNVEHRQSTDGVLEKFDEVLGVGSAAREFSSLMPNEVEEAADYGLRMMNELITVKEPQLYSMGELPQLQF